MGRRSASQGFAPLERWLEVLREVAGQARAAELALSADDLPRIWLQTLMRAAARELLTNARLGVPSAARLFALDVRDAGLEAAIAQAPEAVAARSAAVDSLLVEHAELRTLALPHALGAIFEGLSSFEIALASGAGALHATRRRKKTGMFYTPRAVAHEVAERALSAADAIGARRLRNGEASADSADGGLLSLRICDPACGSGAFLIEVTRALLAREADAARRAGRLFDQPLRAQQFVEQCLFGVDLDPLAVKVAELALWALVGNPAWDAESLRFRAGDALTGRGFGARPPDPSDAQGLDWVQAFPEIRALGFDLIIGNPPWVAFAGRAAQPLAVARRAYFAQHYKAFKGYPTLHAMFVERALELAPRGVVALLVPSPLADLDGYRGLRGVLLSTHSPLEPLLEFGEDAFREVTQPCFALIAVPKELSAVPRGLAEVDTGRAFRLAERERLGAVARAVEPPAVLLRLFESEPLPADLFGEFGFQSNRIVSQGLFLRSDSPTKEHAYPLLEGREVREFHVGAPRLYLRADPKLLRAAGCRLRALEDYQRVAFVVRQTAKYPIAAIHNGLPFRNTLLAGFGLPEFPRELAVGLLNSSLYRALHMAKQRDARQKVFPQVKLAHLRTLPRPPREAAARLGVICELSERAASADEPRTVRAALDAAVFEAFGISAAERLAVLNFARERAPELFVSG